MFTRILLCYEGSDSCRHALQKAALLARQFNASVHLFSTQPRKFPSAATWAHAAGYPCIVDMVTDEFDPAQEGLEQLRQAGIEVQNNPGRDHAIDEIAACACRLSVDLIVIGHNPGTSRFLPKLNRDELARRAHCCVLIVAGTEGVT